MAKFVKYFGKAHLNSMNVVLYENKNAASVRAENVINSKAIGGMSFDSIEEAEEWWESIPGTSAGKLMNAIEMLDVKE